MQTLTKLTCIAYEYNFCENQVDKWKVHAEAKLAEFYETTKYEKNASELVFASSGMKMNSIFKMKKHLC